MKTNVVLRSTDRLLFGRQIRQETKTGFMCLTDLEKTYDSVRPIYGWSERNAFEVLKHDKNIERIFFLLEDQGFIKLSLSSFTELVKKEGVTNVLKSVGVYQTKGRGSNKAVWCNPYIWVLVALELNPMLYAKCIVWITDNLIVNRIEAASMYIGLTSAISKWSPNYAMIAKCLNHCIFFKHEPGIRNTGSQNQLNSLKELESKMAWAVDMGYINSEEQLINELRKTYHNNKKILSKT